jgi:hypothetical protein
LPQSGDELIGVIQTEGCPVGETTQSHKAWVARVLGVNVGGGDMPEHGIVAYRKALLAYRAAKSNVSSRLMALKAAIPAALPHEAELADEVATELETLNDEIGSAIDEAMNAAVDARAPYNAETRRIIARYQALLAEDELVRHVDANPFVEVRMAATLGAALADISQLMV